MDSVPLNGSSLESVKVIVLDSSTLRPDRKNILQWIKRVSRAKQRQVVGGILSIVEEHRHGHAEVETIRRIVSVPSGDSRVLTHTADLSMVHEAYEWAREELMSFFDTNPEFVIFDEIGPEALHGDGLDAALRACLWRINEDPPENPIFLLVIADTSMVHSICDLYRLQLPEVAILSTFEGFKEWLKPAASRARHLMTLKRMHELPNGSGSPHRIIHSSSSSNILNLRQSYSQKFDQSEATGKFYSFIKYPLFCVLICVIAVEFCWYVMVRQAVQVFERLRQRHSVAFNKMHMATSYQSWRRRARELDALDGKGGGTAEKVPLVGQFSNRLNESMATLKRHASYLKERYSPVGVKPTTNQRGKDEVVVKVNVSDFIQHESELIQTLRELTIPSFSELVYTETLYSQNYTGMNVDVKEFSATVVRALELVANIPAPALIWQHLVSKGSQSDALGSTSSSLESNDGLLTTSDWNVGDDNDELTSSDRDVSIIEENLDCLLDDDENNALLDVNSKESEPVALKSVKNSKKESTTEEPSIIEVKSSTVIDAKSNEEDAQVDHTNKVSDFPPLSKTKKASRSHKTLVIETGNNFDRKLKVNLDTVEQAGTRYKARLFAELTQNFGESALCLSGGAGNCYFHLGVIEALMKQNCMPRHVSGASGGALIGSFLCTHTDEELQDKLKPGLLSTVYNPCSEGYYRMFVRLMQEGSLFDKSDWARKLSTQVCGTFTFREAYERTGRSFTITVYSIKNGKEHTRSLNYRTTPDVVIYSAVLASAAIPKLLPAVQLLRKDNKGNIVPYHAMGVHWRDGSFENELPFEALHQMFNVTFTVVSQVEPHISPFFYENRGSAGVAVSHGHGSGWRGGFLFAYLEKLLKLDLKKWLELIREFDLMPRIMDTDFSNVFLGRTYGSVTVVAPTQFSNYFNLVSDPNTKEKMHRYMLGGNQITWPKLSFIQDRMKVEQKLRQLADEFASEIAY